MSNTKSVELSEQTIRNSVRKIISEQKAMKAQQDYLNEGMKLIALYQIAEKKLGNAKSSKLISEAVVSGRDPFKQSPPTFGGSDREGVTFDKDMGLKKIKDAINTGSGWVKTIGGDRNWDKNTKSPKDVIEKLIEFSGKETGKGPWSTSATAQLVNIVSSAASVEGGFSALSDLGVDVNTLLKKIKVDPKIKADVQQKIDEYLKDGEKPESAISKVGTAIAGGLKSAAKSAASWLGLDRMGAGPEKAAAKAAGMLTPEFASKLQNPKTKAAAIAELEALLGSMK